MFVLKRLLQLQAGQFIFRSSKVLNILGVIGGNKEPLIPYDKDMHGAALIESIKSAGNIVVLQFSNYKTTAEYAEIVAILSAGKVESIYQQWSKYPQSPLLTSDFPYQMIIEDGFDDNANGTKAGVTLYLVKQKFYVYSAYGYSDVHQPSVMQWHEYVLTNGAWVLRRSDTTTWVGNTFFPAAITQQNCDVYTDATLTNIRYPKSTS